MLAVLFNLGDQRHGLDSAVVERVVPAPSGRAAPDAPGAFEMISYHGQTVPVVDLARRAGGQAARSCLSTRIILVRYPTPAGAPRLLGLLAERVNEVRHLSAPSPGRPAAPGDVRAITLQELLPADLLAQLPGVEGAAEKSP